MKYLILIAIALAIGYYMGRRDAPQLPPVPRQAVPEPKGAWMYDPERKTRLDEPKRKH